MLQRTSILTRRAVTTLALYRRGPALRLRSSSNTAWSKPETPSTSAVFGTAGAPGRKDDDAGKKAGWWALLSVGLFGPLVYSLAGPAAYVKESEGKGKGDEGGRLSAVEGEGGAEEGGRCGELYDDNDARVPCVIIGGGTAGYEAARSIRTTSPSTPILILTSETHRPYQRPPLSKDLWNSNPSAAQNLTFTDWQQNPTSVYYNDPMTVFNNDTDIWDAPNTATTTVVLRANVTKLDTERQTVVLDGGREVRYRNVLVATGGTARDFPGAPEGDGRVMTFRTIDDFQKLHNVASKPSRIVIIGGGFLGSELAVALATTRPDVKVSQVFPEAGNMGFVFPQYLAEHVTGELRGMGVDVRPGRRVEAMEASDEGVDVLLDDTGRLQADQVLTCIGLNPSTELATGAHILADDGIIVDPYLQTSDPNVFAAGDCARINGTRTEHYDAARSSGKTAGFNMAVPPHRRRGYSYQSMFWTDLGPDAAFEAVGKTDARLRTMSYWTQGPNVYGKGVLFYVEKDKIVGVLMKNLHGRVQVARMALDQPTSALEHIVKSFNLYDAKWA